jgi:transcriptional regulator with XRE-family HTH domain
MNAYTSGNHTYKNFSDAVRELMKAKGFSFPKLAREIGQKLSTTYLHNLATGKSKPTKENIEVIAKGLKISPSYFKEYREYRAQDKINKNPKIADLVLDEKAVQLTSELASLSDEQKQEVVELIRELKAKYRTQQS